MLSRILEHAPNIMLTFMAYSQWQEGKKKDRKDEEADEKSDAINLQNQNLSLMSSCDAMYKITLELKEALDSSLDNVFKLKRSYRDLVLQIEDLGFYVDDAGDIQLPEKSYAINAEEVKDEV